MQPAGDVRNTPAFPPGVQPPIGGLRAGAQVRRHDRDVQVGQPARERAQRAHQDREVRDQAGLVQAASTRESSIMNRMSASRFCAARRHHLRRRRQAVVGHAVAVVVHAVAGLGRGQHLAGAGAPARHAAADDAHLRARAAARHARRPRGAAVAGAGVTRDADAAVVDDAVAVVVDAVAGLGRGIDTAQRTRPSVRSRRSASPAGRCRPSHARSSASCRRGSRTPRRPCRRSSRRRRCNPRRRARRRRGRRPTRQLCRSRCRTAIADVAAARTRNAVDDAVTIVVGAVAGLAAGEGQHLSLARPPARDAGVDHACLRPALQIPTPAVAVGPS